MLNDQVFKTKQTIDAIKKSANIVLEENTDYKNGIEKWDRSNYWIEQRIKKNISNLKNIINDANWYLKRSNIQNFDSSYTKILNSQFNSMTFNEAMNCKDEDTRIEFLKEYQMMNETMQMPIFIMNANFKIPYSTIKYSIELDLNMAPHLNIKDTFDLCLNLKEPTMLVDFIPDMRKLTKEKMPSAINQVPSFQIKQNVFDTVIKLSEEKNYVSSNILIMVLIESLTKDFLKAVYKDQNPNLSEEEVDNKIYNKYLSLNDLLNKIELKEDYPITYGEVQANYQGSTHYLIIKANNKYREQLKMIRNSKNLPQKIIDIRADQSLTVEAQLNKVKALVDNIIPPNFKEEDLIYDIQESIYIPMNVCLEFLQRKMYNDRNQIIHGMFDKIEPWKHYLYLNGLYKLLEVVCDYYAKRKVS